MQAFVDKDDYKESRMKINLKVAILSGSLIAVNAITTTPAFASSYEQ